MKYCRLVLALLLSSIPAFLPGQISAPRVGLVRYASGGVYPVFGLQANYVLGNRLLDSVDSLSFSDAGGLLSRQGTLLLLDRNLATAGSYDAAGTKPIVGIDSSLTTAIAWLPSHHTLVHWNGDALVPVLVLDGTVNGEVFGVSKVGDTGVLLAKSSAGIVEEDTIALRTGILLARTPLPGATGTVYRQGTLTVSVQNGQLVTMPAAGTPKTIPIRADDVSFERMSDTCVHLHAASSGRDWLLHFSGDQSWLFELSIPATEPTVIAVAP